MAALYSNLNVSTALVPYQAMHPRLVVSAAAGGPACRSPSASSIVPAQGVRAHGSVEFLAFSPVGEGLVLGEIGPG